MTLAGVTPANAFATAWGAWAFSWLAAAVWSRQTVARPGYGREAPNRIVSAIGAVLLFMSLRRPDTAFPFHYDVSASFAWAMVACTVAGFAFAWWARLHLGTLWSGNITRKADHRIIDTGPYALVRHPIYTGLLFSAFATAAVGGKLEPFIGAAILSVGLWMKASLEESFLSAELGEQDYAAYRARVPMLVPFLKVSG